MSGERPVTIGPDLELLEQLVSSVEMPVMAEGRVRNPDDAAARLAAGAHAVVVGTAITYTHHEGVCRPPSRHNSQPALNLGRCATERQETVDVGIAESAADAASIAADLIQRAASVKPDLVLGLATGSSPVGIYDELARRVSDGRLSLAAASAFMLDEYVGLPPDHPQAYRSVIDEIFTRVVDIDPAHVHGPDGTATDVEGACADYEQAIRAAGGIDVQILGIGTDGHIAFNEPTSSLASRTRIKTLTRQTRMDNSRFFGGDLHAVPGHCLTQGIGTILDARQIILVAAGSAKAEAVRQAVEGPVSARWPATALQLHPDVTVLLDTAAASRLELVEYYREVWANKPAWQKP